MHAQAKSRNHPQKKKTGDSVFDVAGHYARSVIIGSGSPIATGCELSKLDQRVVNSKNLYAGFLNLHTIPITTSPGHVTVLSILNLSPSQHILQWTGTSCSTKEKFQECTCEPTSVGINFQPWNNRSYSFKGPAAMTSSPRVQRIRHLKFSRILIFATKSQEFVNLEN